MRSFAAAYSCTAATGYSKEFVIEKLYRDAKLTEIFEGTSEIQKKIIAKWMGVK